MTELALKCRDLRRSMSVQLGQHMCFDLCNPELASRMLDIDPNQLRGTFARGGVGLALRCWRVLVSLPGSELSDDPFP